MYLCGWLVACSIFVGYCTERYRLGATPANIRTLLLCVFVRTYVCDFALFAFCLFTRCIHPCLEDETCTCTVYVLVTHITHIPTYVCTTYVVDVYLISSLHPLLFLNPSKPPTFTPTPPALYCAQRPPHQGCKYC